MLKLPSSLAKQNKQVVLFPNTLLEEVEDIELEPTKNLQNLNNSTGRIYDETSVVFPLYGRDLSTVKSPPLASSIYYHYATTPDSVARRRISTSTTSLRPTVFMSGWSNDNEEISDNFAGTGSSTTSSSSFSSSTTTTVTSLLSIISTNLPDQTSSSSSDGSPYDIINGTIYISSSNLPPDGSTQQPPLNYYSLNTTSIYLSLDWGVITQQVETTTLTAIVIALFLLIFPVITVFGNLLVVLSVATERSLRSSTNYYIVSLAFADILVGALVMPFAVYVELVGGVWRLGNFICDIWIACDVMACTASILNLVAISVDRLLAVTKPLLYAHNKSFARVWFSIGAAWFTSAIIASPIILGANNMANRQALMCTFYNADFILGSSFGSFYLPSIAIVAPYFVIFRTLRRRARKLHRMRYGGATVPADRASRPAATAVTVDTNKNGSLIVNTTLAVTRNGNAAGAKTANNRLTVREDLSAIDTTMSAIAKETIEDPFGGVYVGPTRVIVTANRTGHQEAPSESVKEENSENIDLRNNLILRKKIPVLLATPEDFVDDGESTNYLSGVDNNVTNDSSALNRHKGIIVDNHQHHDGADGGGAFKLKARPTLHFAPETSKENRGRFLKPASRPNSLSSTTLVPRKSFNQHRSTGDSWKSVTRSSSTSSNTNNSASVYMPKMKRAAMTKERRATMMTVIVLALFFGCWVPFFTASTVNAVCIRFFGGSRCVAGFLMSTFVWLGYINSLMNPVVYAVFNPEFRKAFRKLLHLY